VEVEEKYEIAAIDCIEDLRSRGEQKFLHLLTFSRLFSLQRQVPKSTNHTISKPAARIIIGEGNTSSSFKLTKPGNFSSPASASHYLPHPSTLQNQENDRQSHQISHQSPSQPGLDYRALSRTSLSNLR